LRHLALEVAGHWLENNDMRANDKRNCVIVALGLMYFLTFSNLLYSIQPDSTLQRERRPRVALVLSGGGALGFAHTGVLSVLEELDMPVDLVVGTSMGSIVGGLYAVGYSAAQLRELQDLVDWGDIFVDSAPRNFQSYQEKEDSMSYVADLRFQRHGPHFRAGLTGGQKVENLLSLCTMHYAGISDFDRLAIPFRAVSADLVSGKEVVLGSGDVVEAMRASMAVPGIFTPVRTNGMVLVDGGVANNLPTDVARRWGADFIIAVDLHKGDVTSEQLLEPVSILDQSMRVMMDQKTAVQRTLADIVITPDLTGFSAVDFDRAEELTKRGTEAARAMLPDIKRALAEHGILPLRGGPVSQRVTTPLDALVIDRVEIEGADPQDSRMLSRLLEFQNGREVQIAELYQRVSFLYASGRYENVRYRLEPAPDGHKVLVVRVVRKELPSDMLRVGYRLYARFPVAESITLALNLRLNDVTTPGSYLNFDLLALDQEWLESEFYQPVAGVSFIAPRIQLAYREPILYSNGNSVAEYSVWRFAPALRLGTYVRRFGEAYVGYEFSYVNASVNLAENPRYTSVSGTASALIAGTHFDSLDRIPFPESGGLANLEYHYTPSWLGNSEEQSRIFFDARRYFRLAARHTLGTHILAGTDFNTGVDIYNLFTLGGSDTLPGLREDALSGESVALASLTYRFRPAGLTGAIRDRLYLSATAAAGNTWDVPLGEILSDPAPFFAGALSASLDTILGVGSIEVGLTTGGEFATYVTFGSEL